MKTKKTKVLIYGPGNAREHATFAAFQQDKDCECYCAIKYPNALLEEIPKVFRVSNVDDAITLAKKFIIDRVFILSPSEIIAGDCDKFRLAGFTVFGASREASILESSKGFAKKFMRKYGVPTPEYNLFSEYSQAECFLKSVWSDRQYVIKSDVFSMNAYDRTVTPESLDEALQHLQRFYSIGLNPSVLLEERISGYELSVHVLVKGKNYFILPLVQDYKKLCDGDSGPMTHGMTALAFNGIPPETLMDNIKSKVIEPTLLGLEQESIEFDSILYFGLMISDDQPYLLEYNVRSGNPEWLSILGLLDCSLLEALDSPQAEHWQEGYSLTSFIVTKGYPIGAEHDNLSPVSLEHIEFSCDIFGESITSQGAQYYPTGGRVFAFRESGTDFNCIKENVLSACKNVILDGKQYRTDMVPFF
jgi:phosphoribosylamine--glycine ligase